VRAGFGLVRLGSAWERMFGLTRLGMVRLLDHLWILHLMGVAFR
jgi:hypothetical protein